MELIVGLNASYVLSESVRDYLTDCGITHLAHAHNLEGDIHSPNYWYSASDLHLAGDWSEKWTVFVKHLTHGGIKIMNSEESLLWMSLLWMHNQKNGMGTAKRAYDLHHI